MAAVFGIASGIDTGSIIQGLMQAARRPVRVLEANRGAAELRKSQLQQFNTLLSDLRSATEALDTGGEFTSFTSSSSQSTALGVQVTGDAIQGSYEIEVVQTATASLDRSDGYATENELLQDGSLDVVIGADVTSVTIDAATGTNTLDGLAAYITDNVEGATAYVLDTGEASDPYRLIVRGSNTGADNDVSLNVLQSGGPGELLNFTTLQDGLDAELLVDQTTVFTDSNTPVDLIPGLTFDLFSTTAGPATVTIGRDVAAMAEKIDGVVDAYNEIIDFLADESQIGSALSGDSTLRLVERRLQTIVSAGYSAPDMTGLRSVGVTTNNSGQLEFDSTDFTTAAGTNFDSVVDMLSGSGGLFTALYEGMDLVLDTTTGVIQPRLDGFDTLIKDIDNQIEDKERRLLIYEDTLQKQFTHMELVLGGYQATGDFLTQQIAALNNSKS